MGLGERVNKIWNDFKLGLAKGLVYGAGLGVLGCGEDRNPSPPSIVTQAQTDEQGETDITDAGGNTFKIIVKDEKTLDPLQNTEISTIYHSTELFSKLEDYIADFKILSESGTIEVLLSKLNDRLSDNLPDYEVGVHSGPINLSFGDVDLIGQDIPLSQLADFYEQNESKMMVSTLEIIADYWWVAKFVQKVLYPTRVAVLENASNIANLLGLNSDEILFDIYKQRGTGLLYHKRVDNNIISNVKPITLASYMRGIQEKDISINFDLSDFDFDLCDVLVEYSTDGGLTFFPATKSSKSKAKSNSKGWLNGLTADPDGESHTFVWDSVADGVATSALEKKVLIRLTPTDGSSGMGDLVSCVVCNNTYNISNNSTTSGSPSAAIDLSGVLHIAWDDNELFYVTYNGTNWSSKQIIATPDFGKSAYSPEIAVGLDGIVHAIWDESNEDIFYSYNDGSGWSPKENISKTSGKSYSARIIVDNLGRPHVVFNDDTSGSFKILYLTKDESWSSPQIVSMTSGNNYQPDIFVDSSGKHAVWYNETLSDIFYSKFVSSWGANQNISNDNDSSGALIVGDKKNNLYAFWDKGSTITYSKNDGIWHPPVAVAPTSWTKSVAVNSHGNVYLTWVRNLGNYEVMYSEFDGVDWSTPKNVSNNSGISRNPVVVIDSSNNSYVIWMDNTLGNYEIFCKKISK